jgi:hypothetical protein
MSSPGSTGATPSNSPPPLTAASNLNLARRSSGARSAEIQLSAPTPHARASSTGGLVLGLSSAGNASTGNLNLGFAPIVSSSSSSFVSSLGNSSSAAAAAAAAGASVQFQRRSSAFSVERLVRFYSRWSNEVRLSSQIVFTSLNYSLGPLFFFCFV